MVTTCSSNGCGFFGSPELQGLCSVCHAIQDARGSLPRQQKRSAGQAFPVEKAEEASRDAKKACDGAPPIFARGGWTPPWAVKQYTPNEGCLLRNGQVPLAASCTQSRHSAVNEESSLALGIHTSLCTKSMTECKQNVMQSATPNEKHQMRRPLIIDVTDEPQCQVVLPFEETHRNSQVLQTLHTQASKAVSASHALSSNSSLAPTSSSATTAPELGTSSVTNAPLPPLSQQQQCVVELLLKHRKNIFFTGSAGTGKSRTLHEVVKKANPATTRITALTGIAACALPHGTTLHSFAGIGLGKGPRDKLLSEIMGNNRKKLGWCTCELLIIDEVSMMSKALFELLEFIARKVRRKEAPFGGIQLCFCGDFFQLPPVSRGNAGGDDAKFCFESPRWALCVHHCIELTKVYRQKDEVMLRLLREVRYNKVSEASLRLLADRNAPLPVHGKVEATRLYPNNAAVDRINSQRLAQLNGALWVHCAKDTPPHITSQMNALTLYPEKLELKVGAQVMMLKNENHLVNGSRGVVESFQQMSTGHCPWPVVRWLDGSESVVAPDPILKESSQGKIKRLQFPLKLAWAMTIHKAQGMSIDFLEVNLSQVFEAGQAYVALSRARTLEGLRVVSFDPGRFWTNPTVVQFYEDHVRPVQDLL